MGIDGQICSIIEQINRYVGPNLPELTSHESKGLLKLVAQLKVPYKLVTELTSQEFNDWLKLDAFMKVQAMRRTDLVFHSFRGWLKLSA